MKTNVCHYLRVCVYLIKYAVCPLVNSLFLNGYGMMLYLESKAKQAGNYASSMSHLHSEYIHWNSVHHGASGALYEAEQQARVTLFMTFCRLDVFEARRGELLELLRRTSIFVL